MEKKEALSIIVKCANIYQRQLLNNNVLFVCYDKQHNKYECFEAAFIAGNFCHMTGVVCRDGLHPKDFYQKCIEHRLSIDDFEFRGDGTTEMKLSVLPEVIKIHTSSRMTGEFTHTGIQLYTEKITGGTKGCMGFVKDKNYYAPNTVLKEDIRDITRSPQHRIVATFIKKIKDEKYDLLSYTAKKFDIKELFEVSFIKEKVDQKVFITSDSE